MQFFFFFWETHQNAVLRKHICKRKRTCFCSWQWEHQKAPYIFAPIECRCFARDIAKGVDSDVISAVKYSISARAELQKMGKGFWVIVLLNNVHDLFTNYTFQMI